jgi:uncharacterized protein YcnI
MHNGIARRRAIARAALTATFVLVPVAQAGAHAIVSPAVDKAGKAQVYTLSVPTEKEKLTTTKVAIDVPKGFGIDSFAPSPGWKRQVVATGSGDNAVVQKVEWSGGHTPTEEDSVFSFIATPEKKQTYTFKVEQTYSDGSVVDWAGPESSDTPAPTIEALSSLGGKSDTLAVIALIVAGIALLLALIGVAGGRRSLT